MVRWAPLRARLAAASAVLLFACESRRPPVAAGEGIAVSASGASQVIAVDPAKVPVLSDCASGELVWRARDGVWGCVSAETLLQALPPDRQAARLEDVAALHARLDAVETSLAALDGCGELPEEVRPPNYQLPASACLISDWRESPPDLWTLDRGWVAFRPGRSGRVMVYCPLLPRCDGSDRLWERLTIVVRDPDGPGTAEQVTATVFRGWNEPVGSCTAAEPRGCQLRSGAETGTSTLTLELGRYDPGFRDRAASRLQHWLELQLDSQGGGVMFGYAQID